MTLSNTEITQATTTDFCGIVAIAAATGKEVKQVKAILGNRGVTSLEIDYAVEKLGIKMERDFRLMDATRPLGQDIKRPTLGQWLKAGYADDGATYIVSLTGHVVAIADGEIVDNGLMFSTDPTPVADVAIKSRKRLGLATWFRIG